MPRALNAYRRLVKLYPAGFRQEYGRPLEQQFLDEYRDLGGRPQRVAFWVRLLADLGVSIPRELVRELRQDVKYAARVYLRHPLVTGLALLALTLAIGTTTGVFGVVNALLLRSLPFRSPERIVELEPSHGIDSSSGFHRWRKQSAYLEDAASFDRAEMNLNRPGDATRVLVTETSYNFFSLFGSEPAVGRGFAEGEDVPGRDRVAVISYALWQGAFGGDVRVLGSTILLNGKPMTVVGVAPRLFDFPARTAVWTPTAFDLQRLPKTTVAYWETIGRVKPGMTLAQANAAFLAALARDDPDALKEPHPGGARLIPLRDQLAGPVRRASLVLMGTVLLVLLVACANVANLVLTRVTDRRREMVVRAALGASRARLAQQLITETVLLGLAGAAGGLVVAQWAVRLASAAQPAQLAVQDYTILDWRVVGFSMLVAVMAGVLFGVVPAWMMARLQPAEDLIRGRGAATPARRFRSALIAVQVAVTVVLLAGSIVLGRSFLRLLETDLGFRPDGALALTVSLAGTPHDTKEGRPQYYRDALERLRSVPDVESVAAADFSPFAQGMMSGAQFTAASGRKLIGTAVAVTGDYFRTLGTRIVAGREFTAADASAADAVIIVDERFAQEIGEGLGIVGQTLTTYRGRRVVVAGVVRGLHYLGPESGGFPLVFMPFERLVQPTAATLLVRVRGDAGAAVASCRGALKSLDAGVAVYGLTTLDDLLWATLARPRFYATVVTFLGAFALLLALIGIYGVASYSIAQRTPEIGVRLALGGTAREIRAMLLRQGLLPVAVGLVSGLVAAFALGRILEHLITKGQRIEPVICIVAVVLLALTGVGALWSATRRVLRLQPLEVLRAE